MSRNRIIHKAWFHLIAITCLIIISVLLLPQEAAAAGCFTCQAGA